MKNTFTTNIDTPYKETKNILPDEISNVRELQEALLCMYDRFKWNDLSDTVKRLIEHSKNSDIVEIVTVDGVFIIELFAVHISHHNSPSATQNLFEIFIHGFSLLFEREEIFLSKVAIPKTIFWRKFVPPNKEFRFTADDISDMYERENERKKDGRDF